MLPLFLNVSTGLLLFRRFLANARLLACLDIMEPVVDLILRVQSLDTPVWKLKLWWPRVKAKLSEAGSGDIVHFPRLKKAGDKLKPGGKYKGVELLEG